MTKSKQPPPTLLTRVSRAIRLAVNRNQRAVELPYELDAASRAWLQTEPEFKIRESFSRKAGYRTFIDWQLPQTQSNPTQTKQTHVAH